MTLWKRVPADQKPFPPLLQLDLQFGMDTDPLSTATRATKRNLLVASIVAIAYRGFDVTVERIPVAGLSIAFNEKLFTFLILCCLLYFLATFSLYYYIDIRNFPPPTHQRDSESMQAHTWKEFVAAQQKSIIAAVSEKLTKGQSVIPSSHFDSWFSCQIDFVDMAYSIVQKSDIRGDISLDRSQSADVYKFADRMLAERRSSFYRRIGFNKFRKSLRWRVIAATYFIRNYLIDGVLPIALAVTALTAVFNVISIRWLQYLVP
jgi:hypothetical protein